MTKRKRQDQRCQPPLMPQRDIKRDIKRDSISADDIDATNRVLGALQHQPSLLQQDPALRSTRKLLFSLLKALSLSATTKLYSAQQLSQIVTSALDDARWSEAVVALNAMAGLGRQAKLGSVQRWVARCGIMSGTEMGAALLRGVMLAADPGCVYKAVDEPPVEIGISRLPNWKKWYNSTEEVAQRAAPSIAHCWTFHAVAEEEGATAGTHQRVWMSKEPVSEQIFSPAGCLTTSAAALDFISGAITISNVLSRNECRALIAAAEQLGYEEASGYSFGGVDASLQLESANRGAEGCVWLFDAPSCDVLFRRICQHLPSLNGAAVGLNARFRFYKYSPGALYKAHIDGAWPASGLDADGQYKFDVSDGRLHSRLTLVLYLNSPDDQDGGFEGGETIFYRPGEHYLYAQGVTPRAGCCLLFPHGDASVGVVHEGSALSSGTKYIIRTDVLYLKQ